MSPLNWNFCRQILARFVCLKTDLKGYCSSLIKSRMTLIMKGIDVFREMALVICSGNCLQECELKHLSVPEGLRWSDLSLTYCTRLSVGQPCPSVLCSRDDFRPNVCLTVWLNMFSKYFLCWPFARCYWFGVIKMLLPMRCMTLLEPPYFVSPCERREFVFELEFSGMAYLCPSAVTLRC